MNITIRQAIAADAPVCADIHIRSWIFAYTGLIPDEIMTAQNDKRPTLWQKMLSGEQNSHFVAVLEDKVIGIITINPPRDTDLPSGTYELTGLYLDPDYIGHGYGRQAMDWVKGKIKATGYERISLWVLEDNKRARRFYEKCGYTADGASKKSGLGDSTEVRYITEISHNNIAYCGLACCVCSENKNCVGCQSGGCDVHGWCKNYNCCREKGINGCWECSDFPCSGSMLDKPRIRAFARFAKEYGTDELARCLLRNKENGIVYHYDGQLVGDYDKCVTEEEIVRMIKTGEKP